MKKDKINTITMGEFYIHNEDCPDLVKEIEKLDYIVNDPKTYGTKKIYESKETIIKLLKEYLEKRYPFSSFFYWYFDYKMSGSDIRIIVKFPNHIDSDNKEHLKKFILNNIDLVKELFEENKLENCENLQVQIGEAVKLNIANKKIEELENIIKEYQREQHKNFDFTGLRKMFTMRELMECHFLSEDEKRQIIGLPNK